MTLFQIPTHEVRLESEGPSAPIVCLLDVHSVSRRNVDRGLWSAEPSVPTDSHSTPPKVRTEVSVVSPLTDRNWFVRADRRDFLVSRFELG